MQMNNNFLIHFRNLESVITMCLFFNCIFVNQQKVLPPLFAITTNNVTGPKIEKCCLVKPEIVFAIS